MNVQTSHIKTLLAVVMATVAIGLPAKTLVNDTGTGNSAEADTAKAYRMPFVDESGLAADSTMKVINDTTKTIGRLMAADTAQVAKKGRDWDNWKPDPKRAMWLALVLPGGGQVYNRKYWKLPIIYGGFLGCAYAMRWNNQMYHDYSQAYMDIMDDDPNTQSYNQFLHLGRKVDDSNIEYFKNIFKRRKDYYRRYRDMSFFIMVGVYAISVIDAYVDASLAQFDISDDLSLRVTPSVVGTDSSRNPLRSGGLGLQCSIQF